MTKHECKEFIAKLPNTISETEKNEVIEILQRIKKDYFNISTSSINSTSIIKSQHNKKSSIEFNFDSEQLKAINSKSKYILLKARAGSGKTAVLVERVKRLLKNGVNQNEILLLAFNKKASIEMKKRVGDNFANSKTFHSFAYSIVKPTEDILTGRKQLLFVQSLIPKNELNEIGNDEISQQKANLSSGVFYKYIRNRSDLTLNDIEIKSNGEKWIADFLFEHDVKFEYEKKINQVYKPDFTINKNIILEHWGIDENDPNDQAPEYWTKDRNEYINEMNSKRAFWKTQKEKIFIETSVVDLKKGREEFENILKSKLEKAGLSLEKLSTSEIINRVQNSFTTIYKITERVAQFITNSQQKNRTVLNNLMHMYIMKTIGSTRNRYKFEIFANDIYKKYEESNKLDFQILLNKATEQISYKDVASLNYILIDEFQDFSPLFYNLIAKIKELKPDVNIFAVGDDWQSINGFAGSSLEYFNNFAKYFDGAEILSMNTNYRSKSAIVEFGNNLFETGEKANSSQIGGQVVEIKNIDEVLSSISKDIKIAILVRNNYEKKEINISKYKELGIEIMTAHKSKGLQFDDVIIYKNSFQKTDSDNKFFEFFGKTEQELSAEEKRLYYVAVTRAKENLYIL